MIYNSFTMQDQFAIVYVQNLMTSHFLRKFHLFVSKVARKHENPIWNDGTRNVTRPAHFYFYVIDGSSHFPQPGKVKRV